MTGDLIVGLFDRQDDAAVTLAALEAMRSGAILGLNQVALVTQDSVGQTTVHSRWWSPLRPGCHVPRILAEALAADDSERRLQALVGAGLDRDFLEEMKAGLSPSRSALLIYIPQDAVADVSQLLSALGLFRGEIYHTTFPAKVEQAILALA